MVVLEIWGSISAYTKNWLVSWSGNKKLLSGADAIGWNSLKNIYIYIYSKKKKIKHIEAGIAKFFPYLLASGGSTEKLSMIDGVRICVMCRKNENETQKTYIEAMSHPLHFQVWHNTIITLIIYASHKDRFTSS